MVQDGGKDEDYFAHFEDLEFTEEDLVRIDRTCARDFHTPVPEPTLPLHELEGEARVTIVVEQGLRSVVPSPSPPRSPMSEPPYDAFRGGKPFSVSDLIGPLWCVDGQRNHLSFAHPLRNIP